VILIDSYDPSNALYGKTAKGPSGFGVEAGIALLMPIVWKLAEKLLSEIYGQSVSALAKKILASIVPSGSDKGPPVGWVHKPQFIVVGHTAKDDATVPATLQEDLNDEIPDFPKKK